MLSQATVIGRSHRLMQHNGQDFAICGEPAPGFAFGVVLDGCGSKYRDSEKTWPSHNNLAAHLLGEFTAVALARRLPHNPDLTALLEALYAESVAFLQGLTALYSFTESQKRRFIATRLLCTVVGFVVTPAEAVFFWAGDGHLGWNGAFNTLDAQNTPDYLAYQLLPETKGRGFQTCAVPNRADLGWLAVATDGWDSDSLAFLAEPRSSLALQRWLNLRAQEKPFFEDDGAVVVWHGGEQ